MQRWQIFHLKAPFTRPLWKVWLYARSCKAPHRENSTLGIVTKGQVVVKIEAYEMFADHATATHEARLSLVTSTSSCKQHRFPAFCHQSRGPTSFLVFGKITNFTSIATTIFFLSPFFMAHSVFHRNPQVVHTAAGYLRMTWKCHTIDVIPRGQAKELV